MEKEKIRSVNCDICGTELTDAEIEAVKEMDFNICCTPHKKYSCFYQVNICRALEGISNEQFSPEQIKMWRENANRQRDYIETSLRELISTEANADKIMDFIYSQFPWLKNRF
jgi:hypothetical protein